MDIRSHRKWIFGALLLLVISFGSYITYEVVSFNRDMKEIGQALGELGDGLGELAQGFARVQAPGDSTTLDVDSLRTNLHSSTLDSITTVED